MGDKRVKKQILIAVLITSVGLTGCSKAIVMTDDENKMVTEYMAGLVLKYDNNYENKLIYDDGTNKYSTDELINSNDNSSVEQNTSNSSTDSSSTDETNQNIESTIKDTTNTSNESKDNNVTVEEKVKYEDVSTVIGISGIDFKYKDYTLTESYPKSTSDSIVTLDASEGNQLLVLTVELKNTTNKDKKINFIGSGVSYSLGVENDKIDSLLTLLPNDIQFLDTTIKAQKTKKAVVVFEVSKDYKIGNSNLYINNNDKIASINIK